eukprot:1406376-Prymnesium_polylepis.1
MAEVQAGAMAEGAMAAGAMATGAMAEALAVAMVQAMMAVAADARGTGLPTFRPLWPSPRRRRPLLPRRAGPRS